MSFAEVAPEMAETADGVLEVGPLRVIPEEFQAFCEDRLLALTHKEFQLLVLLARSPGRVLHRDRIAEAVWGGEAPGRTIDIHVSRLRRRLPAGAIKTVIRVGYRLTL
jgi:two-component system, OmpR family, alkaline phosphatase synthesis response regulator PhoP